MKLCLYSFLCVCFLGYATKWQRKRAYKMTLPLHIRQKRKSAANARERKPITNRWSIWKTSRNFTEPSQRQTIVKNGGITTCSKLHKRINSFFTKWYRFVRTSTNQPRLFFCLLLILFISSSRYKKTVILSFYMIMYKKLSC